MFDVCILVLSNSDKKIFFIQGCGPPSSLGNGTINTGGMMAFSIGTTLTYVCNSGFELNGNSITQCQSSFDFSLDNSLPMCLKSKFAYFISIIIL